MTAYWPYYFEAVPFGFNENLAAKEWVQESYFIDSVAVRPNTCSSSRQKIISVLGTGQSFPQGFKAYKAQSYAVNDSKFRS